MLRLHLLQIDWTHQIAIVEDVARVLLLEAQGYQWTLWWNVQRTLLRIVLRRRALGGFAQ